jgi:hypothetical protein
MNTNDVNKKRRRPITASLACLTALVALVSCTGTGTAPTSFDRDAIVVKAYLFAGRPVSDVKLLHLTKSIRDTLVEFLRWNSVTIALDTVDTIISLVKDSTVDNALVTISSGGVSYRLTFLDSGRYQETSGKLIIAAGQTYRIDVSADGRSAWSQTTVPFPVGGFTASRERLYVLTQPIDTQRIIKDTIGKGKSALGKSDPIKPPYPPIDSSLQLPDSLTHLIVKWNNPSHAYLYCRIARDTILPYQTYYMGGYLTADSLKVTSSIQYGYGFMSMGDSVVVAVSERGRYKILLYSTPPDYQSMVSAMADTVNQDLWNRSPTNINNGVGVFSSFSIDSVFFTIADTTSGS